jgi:hypothetical protein
LHVGRRSRQTAPFVRYLPRLEQRQPRVLLGHSWGKKHLVPAYTLVGKGHQTCSNMTYCAKDHLGSGCIEHWRGSCAIGSSHDREILST